jgi:hypothetical protein
MESRTTPKSERPHLHTTAEAIRTVASVVTVLLQLVILSKIG